MLLCMKVDLYCRGSCLVIAIDFNGVFDVVTGAYLSLMTNCYWYFYFISFGIF